MTDPRGLRLLVARHGATDWNEAGRYQGRTDLDLSAAGVAQAEQLGRWLADEPIDAVIHSGAARCAQTLRLALPAASRSEPPAIVAADQRWAEIDHGDWEGLTYRDLLERHAEQARAHWDDPWRVPATGGETLAQVAERVTAASDDLIARWAGRRVLLLAHATPLQLLLCRLLDAPPDRYWRWKLDLGSLSCLELYAAGPIVNWLNRGYARPAACR